MLDKLIVAAEKHKRFSNLQAKAALAGHQLLESQGGYMIRRWCYSKHVDNLDAVAGLLHKMTGVKPE